MRGYRTIDYMTQGYVALTGLMALLFHGNRLPEWPLYVLGHLVILVAVHILIRVQRKRPTAFLSMLRAFYPMLLYLLLYMETHRFDDLFFHSSFDSIFIGLDRWLFGCQPSQVLIGHLPHLSVSELVYFGYFSYYLMLPGVGFILYFRDRRRFYNYVTVISFVFYVCYLTYIFLPVRGPYAIDEMVPADAASLGTRYVADHLQVGAFYQVMKFVYTTLEPASGAAFPSSHVAVALATLYFSWRYVKRIRWVHLPLVLLLMFSTVYCGYHYAVDVLAGILAAALLVPAGELLWRIGSSRDEEALAP